MGRAVELLKEVAEERPDFVYAPPNDQGACVYVHEGEPSCIVGHVLVRMGVPTEHLDFDVPDNIPTAIGLLSRLEETGLVDVNSDDAWVLERAQREQDSGVPWGKAVKMALS